VTVEAILGYLGMRGLAAGGLYEWICIADSEALAWMNEEQKREQEAMRKRSSSLPSQAPGLGRR
jgi:hypothetical protein